MGHQRTRPITPGPALTSGYPRGMSEWHRAPLSEQHESVVREDIAVADLVTHYLNRITEHNSSINALVHVGVDYALEQAERVQRSISARDTPPLMGLPSADKDLVARAGMPTGYGSLVSKGLPVATTSDPMAVWLDQAGAISVGKTATSEFGMSASTESLATGPTRNPHDLKSSAGGSSGGAAAAVAAGLVPFAPGSDGGGSIRIPAFACGLVGWKPSRGLIPAGSGGESIASLVVPGLITRSVVDLAYAAEQLILGDYNWSTQAPREARGYRRAVESPRRGLTIGFTTAAPWPASFGVEPDAEAVRALDIAKDALVDAGHSVMELPWQPDQSYAENFMTVWAASAASAPVPAANDESLEPLTRFLRERGQATSAVELSAAVAALRLFERSTIEAFSGCDVVMTPGLNGPAPAVGWLDATNPERNFRQQVQLTPWTSFVNVAGLPALAVPANYAHGLPLGVQLIGRPGGDGTLMGAAQQISERLPEAQKWPQGFD